MMANGMSLGEYFQVMQPLFDSNGMLTVSEYNKFWDNLILAKNSISHFVTVCIAYYMYLLSGHNRSTQFADFLLKTSSPSSLQSADFKVCPDPVSDILF